MFQSSNVGQLRESSSSLNFLDSFVKQTQLQVVVRLMHFYDTVKAESKEKLPVDIIIQVLDIVFERKHDETKLKETMIDLDIDPKSEMLTREKIRLVFKEWLETQMLQLDKQRLRQHFQQYDFEGNGIIARKQVKKMLNEADCKIEKIHNLIKNDFDYEQMLNNNISRKERQHQRMRKEKTQRQYKSIKQSPPSAFQIMKKIGLIIIFVLLLQFLLPYFIYLCFIAIFIQPETPLV